MRNLLIPSLLALVGAVGAAEPAASTLDNSPAIREMMGWYAADESASGFGSGSPVANSYRYTAMEAAADAVRKQDATRIAPLNAPGNNAAAIGSALGAMASAAAAEAVAKHDANRVLVVAEMSGTYARDWQGTSAMFALDFGAVDVPKIAIGIATERLAIDDEPVVGAVEGVIRIGLPMLFGGRLMDGRMAVGPAVSARAGATTDGDLVIGLDMMIHTEVSIAPGLGVTADIGAGDRATKHDAAGLQPVGSIGLAFVF